ncbi:MAG: hypothetical protein ABIG44_13830 [Planctomycetota bacterium]
MPDEQSDEKTSGMEVNEEPGMANETTGKSKSETHKKSNTMHEVKFVTYPKLLFSWPIILAGLVFYPFTPPMEPAIESTTDVELATSAAAESQPAAENASASSATSDWLEGWGWAYIWIVFIVLLGLGVDVDRNQAVFWVVLIGAVWILGMLLQERNYTIVGDIYFWFANLNVQYDRKLALAISILLLVPYLIMLIYARLNDRWRITHNEFEHYAFGKSDDSLGRGAKTIRSSYPDMLELLLGLAGTLVVYNATGTKELRRIPHVILLPMVRKRLNVILERTAITGLAAIAEEEEDDEEM